MMEHVRFFGSEIVGKEIIGPYPEMKFPVYLSGINYDGGTSA